jgi:hypothetical protein
LAPYSARAELYRNARNFTDTLHLRLDPIGASYQVPLSALLQDQRGFVDAKIDIARNLLRSTRKFVTLALYKAVFEEEAPADFDWEAFDRDELADALKAKADLTRRVEHLQRVQQNYRGFMEANGRNWQAIEKLAA